MRVVIVGGAGFIGSSLVKKLYFNDMKCVVLDSSQRLARSAKIVNSDVQYHEFDFFGAPESIEDFIIPGDTVIHLASSTHPAKSMQNIAFCAESNIIASIKLFEALQKLNISRLVFASSGGTVYGMPTSFPIKEDDDKKPINAYGISKLAIEHYLNLFQEMSGVSLRISNPFGTYQLQGTTIGLIANVILSIKDQQSINIWGDGSTIRDYIFIDDVTDAILLSLDIDLVPPTTYNIGTGIGYSITDVISLCFKLTERSVQVNYQNKRAYDSPKIVLDCSKFSSTTDWSPKISLQEGILKLIEQIN